jgi:hypothetical protein
MTRLHQGLAPTGKRTEGEEPCDEWIEQNSANVRQSRAEKGVPETDGVKPARHVA